VSQSWAAIFSWLLDVGKIVSCFLRLDGMGALRGGRMEWGLVFYLVCAIEVDKRSGRE